ncbi:MAG: recombinase family protein [Wolbachia sp.]
MTAVALYARVSSKQQAQNNTIASQIAELRQRIATDKHELLDEYEFTDDGYSGWNLDRPDLDKLRDKVAEGQIEKIYIHSPDRLSRKSAYQMILLEEFEKGGVEVVFLNHKTDNNPESKLLLGVQGLISEYECAKIMERSRRGKLHAARKGRISVMGNAPYGYRYVKHVVREEAEFEINEEEAKVVKELFMWIGKEKVSIREAVRRLKERSIRTQTGKEIWHPSTIHGILKNPAYKGQAAFGRTKAGPIKRAIRPRQNAGRQRYSLTRVDEQHWIHIPIPSIVDEALFNAVQERMDENRKRMRIQGGKEIHLLQSLVVCQRCRYAYYGTHCGNKRRKIYHYYRCSTADVSRCYGKEKCDNKSVRGEMLETAVWEEVKSLLKNPERIMEEYQRRISEHKNDESLDERFARRENQLKQSIEKLMEDYYSQGEEKYMREEEYKQTMKKLKERLREIEEEKKKVADQKKLQEEMDLIKDSIKRFSSGVKSELDHPDWQTKRNIIEKVVKQIDIGLDKVDVVFEIKELDDFAQNMQGQSLQHCRRIGHSATC